MDLTDSAVVPTEAATVLLVRDAPSIEVFLLERHLDSDFVGGAYVFPGGKVDAKDHDLTPSVISGQAPPALIESVGINEAYALTIAAIRETFEEAGVLMGRRDGRPITAQDLLEESFVEARYRLASRELTWDWTLWLIEERIELDLDSISWWSWWVTPIGVHRRFDTKFFIAHLPTDQAPIHDNIETTDSRWATPSAALAAQAAGRVSIILPTRKNLTQLAAFDRAEEAIAASRRTDFARPRIEPTVTIGDGGRTYVQHPTFDGPEPV